MDGWPSGATLIHLDRVDSTNEEARRRLTRLDGPTWIIADEQTQGKGRRGRVWKAPAGNLNASFVFPLPGRLADAALRSFVASLALIDTFDQITGKPERFALKWPNDVLMDGCKIAGILLETMGSKAGQPTHLCIGMGVNLVAAPKLVAEDNNAFAAISLTEATGKGIAPLDFLSILARQFELQERRMRENGFEDIRRLWLARAAKRGERIVAIAGSHHLEGIFQSLDKDGCLVLETAEGQKKLAAADIHFPNNKDVTDASGD